MHLPDHRLLTKAVMSHASPNVSRNVQLSSKVCDQKQRGFSRSQRQTGYYDLAGGAAQQAQETTMRDGVCARSCRYCPQRLNQILD
jgi:hypothetical protein